MNEKNLIDEMARNRPLGWVPSEDMVNRPAHYTHGKWEVIDVLEEFFGEDPLLWQVGKYIMRHEHKENSIQDLEKAKWYLERKINKLKEQQHG
jgi:hypothetical protein